MRSAPRRDYGKCTGWPPPKQKSWLRRCIHFLVSSLYLTFLPHTALLAWSLLCIPSPSVSLASFCRTVLRCISSNLFSLPPPLCDLRFHTAFLFYRPTRPDVFLNEYLFQVPYICGLSVSLFTLFKSEIHKLSFRPAIPQQSSSFTSTKYNVVRKHRGFGSVPMFPDTYVPRYLIYYVPRTYVPRLLFFTLWSLA